MARSALTVLTPVVTGLDPAHAAANVDGNSVPGTADIIVEVVNGAGAPITVTVPTPATVGGLAITDGGGTVPAGGRRWFGPFRADLFNQADGTVSIDYSAVTSVTVTAIRVRN